MDWLRISIHLPLLLGMHPLCLNAYIKTISAHASKISLATNTSSQSHVRFEQGQLIAQVSRRLSLYWTPMKMPAIALRTLCPHCLVRKGSHLWASCCATPPQKYSHVPYSRHSLIQDRPWPLYPASACRGITNLAPWQRVAVLIQWPDHAQRMTW